MIKPAMEFEAMARQGYGERLRKSAIGVDGFIRNGRLRVKHHGHGCVVDVRVCKFSCFYMFRLKKTQGNRTRFVIMGRDNDVGS